MDLGIAGRKAIVCASSRGLGKGCAMALAQAGCEVVVNGRDEKTLDATANEIAKATKVKIIPVAAWTRSSDIDFSSSSSASSSQTESESTVRM